MEFHLTKRNGKWLNQSQRQEYLNSLPDGYYVERIEARNKRSGRQNSYYWSVVVPMVYQGLREAGFDAVRNLEDAHEVMKNLFLKIREERNGVVIERVKSTTELNKEQFSEYLEHITIWAWDYLTITIPAPNTQLEAF